MARNQRPGVAGSVWQLANPFGLFLAAGEIVYVGVASPCRPAGVRTESIKGINKRSEDERRRAQEWRVKMDTDAAGARKEIEEARVAEAEKTLRLRALRLAKEATDIQAGVLVAEDKKVVPHLQPAS